MTEFEEFLLQVIEGQADEIDCKAEEFQFFVGVLKATSSELGQAIVRIRELEGNPVSVLGVLEAAGGFE